MKIHFSPVAIIYIMSLQSETKRIRWEIAVNSNDHEKCLFSWTIPQSVIRHLCDKVEELQADSSSH